MNWRPRLFKKKTPKDELIGTWKTEDDLFFKIDIVYYLSFLEHDKGYLQTWCWTNGDNGEVATPITWHRLNTKTIQIKKEGDTTVTNITYNIDKSSDQLVLHELKTHTESATHHHFWVIPKPLFRAVSTAL